MYHVKLHRVSFGILVFINKKMFNIRDCYNIVFINSQFPVYVNSRNVMEWSMLISHEM